MWRVVMLCLVVGCVTPGPEMRPRGLRNSARIESLERRIAKAENKLGITPERPPPIPRTDLPRDQLADFDTRLDAIDARLTHMMRVQSELEKQVAELRAAAPAPSPEPAPASP